MIFVTVGNATQGFLRLLNGVERLKESSFLGDETVKIQAGSNRSFKSSVCDITDFLPANEFAQEIKNADLIIAHGGAGTLIYILQSGKIPVVMPRRKVYGEHVDDHQMELVQALAAERRIVPAYEPEDLPDAIKLAMELKAKPSVKNPPMLGLVQKAIEELIVRP